jgi:hypothetical protein
MSGGSAALGDFVSVVIRAPTSCATWAPVAHWRDGAEFYFIAYAPGTGANPSNC